MEYVKHATKKLSNFSSSSNLWKSNPKGVKIMVLINALIELSKLNKESAQNPDKHNGYEMGTWNWLEYCDWFDSLNIKHRHNKKKDGIRYYKFTKKEKKIILNNLKKAKKVERKGKEGYRISDKTNWYGGYLDIHTKWYNRLIDLFSSKDVIEYSC